MLWLLTLGVALAGDGPWTLGPRESNLYLGYDYYQYSLYTQGGGSKADIPSPITAMALTPVWTAGVRDGVEVEIKAPFERARAQDPDGCAKVQPIADWCHSTQGVGDLAAVAKVRLLDELYGRVFTLSALAGVRTGELYADHRQRLTTLGDGQTDVGGGLSIGRTDVAGRGWYRASMDLWYWYRFPTLGARLHDEVDGSAALMVAVLPSFGFGPAINGFWRLGGVDVSGADFSNPDVWGTLAARQIQAGGKLGLFARDRGPTISLTVLRTIYGHDNPTDATVVSVGLGWFRPAKER